MPSTIAVFVLLALLLSGCAPVFTVPAPAMAPHEDVTAATTQVDAHATLRRVNVPYWADGAPYPSRSIFWFGRVDGYANSADVRMIYTGHELKVDVHIVDRLLYQSGTEGDIDLTQWDAVSVYLNLDGARGGALTAAAYRFDVQLLQADAPNVSRRAFRGDGEDWVTAPVDFTAETSWRGMDGPNSGRDAKGWVANLTIPFAALGLTSLPLPGTRWGVALVLHDRDGPDLPVVHTRWPAEMDANTPATWGQLNFGWYAPHLPGALDADGVTTIRQGVDGAAVPDAHVGGHGNCGEGLDHWTEWGEAKYPGETQINIQNQWDIADYPCFSKYFITFPLDAVPAGTQVVSATVTLYLFGNAGYEPGDAQPSAIQALTIDDDWDEQTLTWNNAPRARENIALTWVEPVDGFDPGVPYRWDVSDAAAVAFGAGEPLRLAFYSADGEYHSGKYFWSSDAAEAVRPRLDVAWRHAPEDAAPGDEGVFLPLLAPP